MVFVLKGKRKTVVVKIVVVQMVVMRTILLMKDANGSNAVSWETFEIDTREVLTPRKMSNFIILFIIGSSCKFPWFLLCLFENANFYFMWNWLDVLFIITLDWIKSWLVWCLLGSVIGRLLLTKQKYVQDVSGNIEMMKGEGWAAYSAFCIQDTLLK